MGIIGILWLIFIVLKILGLIGTGWILVLLWPIPVYLWLIALVFGVTLGLWTIN